MSERNPVHVHCRGCAHSWVAAYTPMEMGKFAKALQRAGKGCPSCGGREIFMGQGKPAQSRETEGA